MHYNSYGKQLTDEEIKLGEHRKFVGSYWDQLGKLQFDYLKKQGLKPHHKLLDLGCGALRGGIHFIRYLEDGHYTGIDANASLIRAGKTELKKVNLDRKSSNFIIDENFEYRKWGGKFDYIISISLFTHLPITIIEHCISSVAKVMVNDGAFYFSFFLCKEHKKIVVQNNVGLRTHPFKDPYHQTKNQIETIAEKNQLKFEYIVEWKHPRNQKMACLRNE